MTNDELEQIRLRALDGQSSRQIAEHSTASQSTISRLIRENGWGASTVIGKDGRHRKGRRPRPKLNPAPGECGICDDPECDGHNEPLEPPNEYVPCWACARTGAVRGEDGRRTVPCTVCYACGWLVSDRDDHYPSNQFGATWAAAVREEYERDGYDVWATATAWSREADWKAQQNIVGPTVVSKASTVSRNWRDIGDRDSVEGVTGPEDAQRP